MASSPARAARVSRRAVSRRLATAGTSPPAQAHHKASTGSRYRTPISRGPATVNVVSKIAGPSTASSIRRRASGPTRNQDQVPASSSVKVAAGSLISRLSGQNHQRPHCSPTAARSATPSRRCRHCTPLTRCSFCCSSGEVPIGVPGWCWPVTSWRWRSPSSTPESTSCSMNWPAGSAPSPFTVSALSSQPGVRPHRADCGKAQSGLPGGGIRGGMHRGGMHRGGR
jgi:hypothetical protein